MKLLCSLYPYDRWDSIDSMSRCVRHADKLGFYGLQFSDHVVMPVVPGMAPIGDVWPDNLILASHFAAETTQLRFVFYVIVVPLRNPVHLAKQVATLDAVSGGRVVFGVGSGWLEEEFDVLGVPFAEREELLDEYVRAMKELWSSESPAFSGKHVSFSNLKFLPRPVQRPHPQLLIGGHGPRARRRLAEYGGAWAPMVGSLDELAEAIEATKDQLTAQGQKQASLDVMFTLQVGEGDDFVKGAYAHIGEEEAPSTAPAKDWTEITIETLREYSAVGVTHMLVFFKWHTPDDYIAQLDWLAKDVIPAI